MSQRAWRALCCEQRERSLTRRTRSYTGLWEEGHDEHGVYAQLYAPSRMPLSDPRTHFLADVDPRIPLAVFAAPGGDAAALALALTAIQDVVLRGNEERPGDAAAAESDWASPARTQTGALTAKQIRTAIVGVAAELRDMGALALHVDRSAAPGAGSVPAGRNPWCSSVSGGLHRAVRARRRALPRHRSHTRARNRRAGRAVWQPRAARHDGPDAGLHRGRGGAAGRDVDACGDGMRLLLFLRPLCGGGGVLGGRGRAVGDVGGVGACAAPTARPLPC